MAAVTHWEPSAPFSYPIPSKGPHQRVFLLSMETACGQVNWYSRTGDISSVTCKRCQRIHMIGRFDTPETVNEVLSRGAAE